MKTAVIIHGMPSKEEYLDLANPAQSNRHWFPWLQKQLAIRDVVAQSLEMPEPYTPVYEKWRTTFEQMHLDENTALFGHSCGGGFFVRWLSENKKNVGQVVLVAPWLDTEKEIATGFFDFEIDSNFVSRTKGVTIMYSTDDGESILNSVALLKEKLPDAVFKEFTDKGHFCSDNLINNEFPEILEVLNITT
jgi:predicted alpha/beta hydrolase family esterase